MFAVRTCLVSPVHFLSGSYFICLISLLFIGSFFSGLLLYWLFVDSRQVLDAKQAEALGKQGKQIGEESIKQTLESIIPPTEETFGKYVWQNLWTWAGGQTAVGGTGEPAQALDLFCHQI